MAFSRRKFIVKSFSVLLSTHLLGCLDDEIYAFTPSCDGVENSLRKKRFIMNNDGNDLRKLNGQNDSLINDAQFISERTSGLEKTAITTISYSTGIFNKYTHKSELTEHFSQKAANTNLDPLQAIIDYGKENKKEIWWSMRMNDTHDSWLPKKLSKWKKDNPDCLMGNQNSHFEFGGNRWSALNYENEKVRIQVLRIIEDVLSNYEVDGIELDFFRHPVFFFPQMIGENVNDHQRSLMTQLIQDIRSLVDKKSSLVGKNLALVIRIPDSIEYSMAIGLDVDTWLCEELLDAVVIGGYFKLNKFEVFDSLQEHYNVSFYPCLSNKRLGKIEEIESWRGETIRALESKLDGLYFFNAFYPDFELYKELKSLELMKSRPHTLEEKRGRGDSFWLKRGWSYRNL